jgi:hypothetical protein
MPEGPSIVILNEHAAHVKGKKLIKAGGDAKVDIDQRYTSKKNKSINYGDSNLWVRIL